MKPLALLLAVPVPALVAAVVPQVQPELLEGLPGWVATGLLGVWVTLWFLDRVGKLPGRGSGERFTSRDREKLDRLVHLFLFRGDEDGIERFPKFMQEARASDRELAGLIRQTNQKLDRLIAVMERRPG